LAGGFAGALQLDRDQGSLKPITHQTSQAVVGCGFDENLQQGASYFQRCKYLSMLRVIAENFAAKLPPSPQLTVLEYLSLVRSRSSRYLNINLQTT
jgi:hypothetical protein